MATVHVWLLLHTPLQDAQGVLHTPWCQNILEAMAENRFLCASHTSNEKRYMTSMRWGHPDLQGKRTHLALRIHLQKKQNTEAWSIFTVPAAGQEPLFISLLLAFVRDWRKSGSRSDPIAWYARKWTCTQWAPRISHLPMWRWISWDYSFCYLYAADLDLLNSMYMSWKTHLLMCWKSCIQNLLKQAYSTHALHCTQPLSV